MNDIDSKQFLGILNRLEKTLKEFYEENKSSSPHYNSDSVIIIQGMRESLQNFN